jgi:large subunit ribosomal protein L17
MVIPKKGRRFGGNSSAQKAIMRNLAISLFENKKIKTTVQKARFLRSFVDKLITTAKKDNLAARRQCIKLLGNAGAVQKLFNEIAPGMYERSSGFTRTVKYKNRVGDGAELVIMELLIK